MKRIHPWTWRLAGALALLIPAWACFVGGCAGPSASAGPKPGRGIAEYRQVTRDAHRSVTGMVQALDTLARALPAASAPPALAGFDRAMLQLELDSIQARARAEAIITRGQSYFHEWNERLAAATNQTAASIEQEHFDRLFSHFDHVRHRSGEVREEFRPFMARLRSFRARIDKSPTWLGDVTARSDAADVTASGRRVLQALNSVSVALNDAEAELRKTSAPPR